MRSLQDACATLRSHTALLLSDVCAAVEGRSEGPAIEVAGSARRLEQVGGPYVCIRTAVAFCLGLGLQEA